MFNLCVVRVCLSVRVVSPPTCLWNAFHSSFPLVRISLVAVLVTVHVTAVEARTRICTHMNASQRKKALHKHCCTSFARDLIAFNVMLLSKRVWKPDLSPGPI